MQVHNAKRQNKHKKSRQVDFPTIPDKLYFTIGEVGELCLIAPYVIRFWEHEFAQLKPAKRRCNRRYYQQEQILLIRKIRNLLYQEGFTIEGARTRLLAMSEEAGARIEGGIQSADDTTGLSLVSAQMIATQVSEDGEAKNLFGVERVMVEKIVQVKDTALLKEIAINLEEMILSLEAGNRV